MKTNREIAELYAQNTTLEAQSLHMFIENGAIYSYGTHFPIAFRTGQFFNGKEIVFFNSDGYSNTTARHKSHVFSALCADSFFIEIPTQPLIDYILNVQYGESERINKKTRSQILQGLINDRDHLQGKAQRAHKDQNKEYYTQEAENKQTQIDIIKNKFAPLHPAYL